MVGVGELVEQRAAADPVRVVQLGDVLRQGFRVARNVQDALEASGQLAGVRIHAGSWRIDEDTAEGVALQVDVGQAAERANLVQRLGQLFGRQAHQADVVHRVVGQVGQRRIDRGLADLGGQHLAYPGGQGQGEVAVAAVQFEQVVVALAERLVGPAEHLLVDLAVGLGESPLGLAVAEAPAGDRQFLLHIVASDDDALAARTPHQVHAQFRRELFRCLSPGVVDRPVVAEGDQRVAGQGGEKLHLEQLEAQRRVGPGRLQARHQFVDAAAGDGEILDQDRRVLVAVMLARRLEDLRRGCRERGQQSGEAGLLVFQLRGVGAGVELWTAHALKKPSLITNSTERITSAGFSSRQRPDSTLIAVQEMKPKAMPVAIE